LETVLETVWENDAGVALSDVWDFGSHDLGATQCRRFYASEGIEFGTCGE